MWDITEKIGNFPVGYRVFEDVDFVYIKKYGNIIATLSRRGVTEKDIRHIIAEYLINQL